MSLKSVTYEKLTEAVEQASPTTVEGVQILAMSASAVKNLNEGTDIEEDVYQIGEPGEIGFGVGAVRDELLPDGWVKLEGHDNIISKNYGNVLDANGSVLVFIPKHYYKIIDNNISISHTKKSGYVLDRAFVNAGKEQNGVFVYKYGATNDNGIFASKRGLDPLSTHSAHNPINALQNTPSNTYGGLYTAVKSAGSKYFLTTVFIYSMLARLSKAHGQAATSTASCSYIDVNPKMPKGNLANALKDVNDSSVTFVSSGYSNCALTGSGEPFAKTTHNGQECGIADLNGNMWEVASGFIRTDANGFLVLKESVDITSIANDSVTQGGGGAYDIDLYDVIDISDLINANDGWTYLGNGANQVFGMSTDRNSDTFKRTAIGIPLSTGVSAAGTTEFGNDGIYRYLRNEMACLCGARWSDSSNGGPLAVAVGDSRTNSNVDTGGRASVFV